MDFDEILFKICATIMVLIFVGAVVMAIVFGVEAWSNPTC